MDSPKPHKSDPAVLLLNEVDILLAQTRVIELCLKQTQATAANETARIHEEYQAELERLRSRLALFHEARPPAADQTTVGAPEQKFHDAALQNQLAERQRLLESRDAELQTAKSETAMLRDRVAELEMLHRQAQAVAQEFAINRQDLQVEFAAVRQQLAKKQEDFEKQQLISRTLQAGLEEQLAQVQDRLREGQSASQVVETELQQAIIEIATLHGQVAQLQTSHQAAETGAQELEQTRFRLEAEIADLQIALAGRDRALQENDTTIAQIEHSLKTDIVTLRSQLEQKQELVEFRDDELRDVHGQLAALQQRILELESVNQSATANAEEIERIRRSFEAELTVLQQQVAARDLVLSERQEAASAVELTLHSKIQALQQEQARDRSVIDERENELRSVGVEMAALRHRIGQLEVAAGADLTARQFAEETCRGLEAELTSLHATLAQKEYALKEQENFFRSVEDRLGNEISQLRSELEQRQTASESNNAELERLRSQVAELQQRNEQAELALRQLEEDRQQAGAHRLELEARLQAKENEFRAAEANAQEQKEAALREQENRSRSAEEQLSAEINRLRTQLEEQHRISDQGNAEFERLQSEITALQELNAQAELARRQFEKDWQHAGAQRQELEARLQAKDDELRAAEANAQEQKEAALREQEKQFRSVEDRLAAEINELRGELTQGRTANESSNAELERLRSQVAELKQRNDQAELALRQLEEDRQQAGAHRLELQARLQAKEDEFRAAEANAQEQKEAALREQERQSRSAEEQLSAEINQLRTQLEEQHRISDQGNAEFERLRSEIAALQEQTAHSERSRQQLEENRQGAVALAQELEARLLGKENELRAAEANAQEEKEAALREQEILFKAVEQRLAAETNRLRTQLEEQYGLFGQGNAELERLRSEIAQFREQSEQSGHLRRELEENWRRVVASEQELRTSLLAKEDELRDVRTKGDEFKIQFEAAISQLQLQLTEKGLLAESRAGEIENLQAEINRLSEQLAQRESAQDNFQKEIESIRTTYRTEIAALHQEHRGNQQELDNQLARERENAADLRRQIAERERLSEEAQTALKIREQEFAGAAAEAATLRAHLRELETTIQIEKAAAKTETDQALSRLETESISLRSDLQQKSWALAQQQATVENLALAHKNQIQKLEAKLAEQQHGVQERNLALERAESQGRALHRRIEELESELQHAQLTGLSRAEQVAQDAGRIEELNSQLAEKTSLLQNRELEGANLSDTLRNELDRLVREAEERNQILQNRNDELVRVKAEMDSLHERFTQLESSTSRAKSALAGETERMRTELQAQLALLQAELSQKEWALEERDATARGLEQTYHEEIESLRKRLAEQEAGHKPDGNDYVLGEPRLTQAEEERFHVTDSTQSSDQHSRQAAQNRRWRNGFAWKRRWKS